MLLQKNAYLAAISLLVLCLFLAACAPAQSIERRAHSFYSFLTGHRPSASFKDYISPAFRSEIATEQGKARLDMLTLALRPSSGTELDAPELENVRVQTEGDFALTWLEGRPDLPLIDSPPMRWVKARGRWYLYFGTAKEYEEYKDFPSALRREEPEAPSGSELSEPAPTGPG